MHGVLDAIDVIVITEAVRLFSDKEIWIIQLWNHETFAWLILGMPCNMLHIFNVKNAIEWRQLFTPLMLLLWSAIMYFLIFAAHKDMFKLNLKYPVFWLICLLWAIKFELNWNWKKMNWTGIKLKDSESDLNWNWIEKSWIQLELEFIWMKWNDLFRVLLLMLCHLLFRNHWVHGLPTFGYDNGVSQYFRTS